VSEVEKRLTAYDDLIEVSVLGSAGRGIGEARYADFGITGAKDSGIVFARGQPLKKVPTEELVEELFSEIDKYYAAGKKLIVNDAQAAQAARWLSENEDETAI
jgi:(E)-4-hydroxy-3-methylbut-2-enyl-diphosphate synthase